MLASKILCSHETYGCGQNYLCTMSYDLDEPRPVPFHDFMLFVGHSLFMGGSPNAGRKYSACVGGTGREKREDNK